MKFTPLALLLSANSLLFAGAALHRNYGCPPRPEPIRDIKFTDSGGDSIHNYELYGNARIVEPAPEDVPRALRIDSLFSYALLKDLDISPSKMRDMTFSIGVYIESVRPAAAIAPDKNQNEAYGWVMSHDNGGYDRAIFLHDERFNGIGITSGTKIPANRVYTIPPLKKWIQIIGVWRQGGECAMYIDSVKHTFSQPIIGKNNNGLKDVALGAPQARRYGKENDNDVWIKDVKVFDYALDDDEIDAMKCNFDQDLQPNINCGDGGDLVFSCTDCPYGTGASGCSGDCMWNPSLGACVDDGVDDDVSCGDHDAADCTQCDVSGGPSGCSGECKFADGECRPYDWEPPVDCGNHEAASCGECPNGEGASGCAGDCMWDPSLGECTEDDGNDVSCGTHDAADCSQCDVNADGTSGCNGACKFADGECRPFDWEPPAPAQVCTISQAGLAVKYYRYNANNLPANVLKNYSPFKSDTVSKLHYNNGEGNAFTSGLRDHVAATFEGFLYMDKVGTYEICFVHDDGVNLHIDDNVIMNAQSHGTTCKSVTVQTAGPKKLLIEYFEYTGPSHLHMTWKKPGSGSKQTVPESAFVKETCTTPGEAPLCSASAAGLAVKYYRYNANNLPANVLKSYSPFKSDTVSKLHYNNGEGNAFTSGLRDHVAATFEGFLYMDKVGTYEICFVHDDGVNLHIDDNVIMNAQSHGTTCKSVTVQTAGPKKLLIEYFEYTGPSHLHMTWKKPGSGSKQTVPESAFVEGSCTW